MKKVALRMSLLIGFSFFSINYSMQTEKKSISLEFIAYSPQAAQHFGAIKKIRLLLHQLLMIERNKPTSDRVLEYTEDCSKLTPNPLYWQTKRGLLLSIANEIPICLATPWGEIELTGAYRCSREKSDKAKAMWKTITAKLLASLSTALYERHSDAYITYQILSAGSIRLPQPELFKNGYWAEEDRDYALSRVATIWSQLNAPWQ